MLEAVLQAEDARAPGEPAVALLTGALSHGDTLVIRRAARAIGRLERPALAGSLFPLLHSPSPALRRTAAEAIAQAAQGFRRDSSPGGRGPTWTALLAALRERMRTELDPAVLGTLSLSLGRLPYLDPAEITMVRRELVRACEASFDQCRGVELLLRGTWRRVPLEETLRTRLRSIAREARRGPGSRRHALGALLVSQSADDTTLTLAVRAPDPELRRLALTGVRRVQGRWQADPVVSAGLADSEGAVRLEALRALARAGGASGCSRIVAGTRDRTAMVSLVAIDLLAGCGGNAEAINRLETIAISREPSAISRQPSAVRHQRAHALVALARAAPLRAAPLIPELAVHADWQIRMYAARAAAPVRDTLTLRLLADDLAPNVRAAAISGLSEVVGHAGDPVYIRALGSPDYQLVLTAAAALAGTADRAAVVPALLAALGRITLAQAETSRDPRIALLVRLREVGSSRNAGGLEPYLTDFDPAVADSAAAILSAWTGTAWQARPQPPAIDAVTLSEVAALRGARAVFTMAGNRQFVVELLVEDAPVTVARIARLVRRHFYDGLTFHRWAPNFVIQGGSPGANEYAGVPGFMRDELGQVSHARGTLGVSTRGRDTGDGQIFINLRDNPRLDYDYTVWGRVVSGMAVVDAILEGDEIRRVEIRPR